MAKHADEENGHLLTGVTLKEEAEIPEILPCDKVPLRLVAWSEARATAEKSEAWLHFFEDDCKFSTIWDDSDQLFSTAKEFAGIISPDFSLYLDAPNLIKIKNTYKNYLLGAAAQVRGIPTIANVRMAGRESAWYTLAGTPHNSVIAIGLHGTIKNRKNRTIVKEEIEVIVNTVEPKGLLVYGSSAYGVLDYPKSLGIPIHTFAPDTYIRSQHRKAA
ncbi:DUF4417 domain-containing protein [Actinotignum sp. GS-2025a]